MILVKILNNNAIICENDDKSIIIAIGKGLGFQRKIGDAIDTKICEKIFIEGEVNLDNISNLFTNVSHQYIDVVSKIIQNAEKELNKKFKSEIYYNLISHCQFAIERYQNNIPIINNLFWEIKNLYKEEYKIGIESVKMINDEFNVELNEEEAAFIAIHLIDAELGHDSSKVILMTELIDAVMRIIKYNLGIEKNKKNEFDFARLISHLRQFITHNLYENNANDMFDNNLHDFKDSLNDLSNKYPEITKCVQEIKNYIQFKFNHKITTNDEFYLAIHVAKISNHSK
ncbi:MULTISPECIES: PRD domain-containing protein [Mesoplasma]|uniref:PRD domain-containing protein n=1 Tax=Mesoplasma florum TaxID=2151 RepID=A0A2R3P7Y9_MESFO|nr:MULTISPECIES: PRD domain-containing protein [Mesoplasma]AVN64509.1 hypothetical protein CG003_02445 [Mesoplasma florum]